MNPYRLALEAAVDLARRGLPLDAAERINPALDEAFKRGSKDQASLLARNAALFCEQGKELERARGYYARFLEAFGSDAAILFALSLLDSEMGDVQGSVNHRELARRVAAERGDSDILDLLGDQ